MATNSAALPWLQAWGADAQRQLGLDPDALAAGNVVLKQQAIQDVTPLLTADRVSTDLLPFTPIETLIAQAASLLDRVLVDNASYRQLAVDRFRAYLEVKEFVELDLIQDKEIADGSFRLNYYETSLQSDSDKAALAARAAAQTNLVTNQGRQAALAGWVAYNELIPSLNVPTLHVDETDSGYAPRTADGRRGVAYDIGQGFAIEQTNYTFTQRIKESQAEIDAASARSPWLDKKHLYPAFPG